MVTHEYCDAADILAVTGAMASSYANKMNEAKPHARGRAADAARPRVRAARDVTFVELLEAADRR